MVTDTSTSDMNSFVSPKVRVQKYPIFIDVWRIFVVLKEVREAFWNYYTGKLKSYTRSFANYVDKTGKIDLKLYHALIPTLFTL